MRNEPFKKVPKPKIKMESEVNFLKNKRGQLTIFIIIAVVIVLLGVLAYILFPGISTGFVTDINDPQSYIQNCMEDHIEETVSQLSLQGGSLNPSNYFPYQENRVEYLCYTSEYYVPCIMQQPFLKQHIEAEIKNDLDEKETECFDLLRDNFESRGYDVSLTKGEKNIELLPKRIAITFNNQLTITKDETDRYENFKVTVNSNLYELVGVANSILNWEARYGDSETTTYMNYYHNLKVEKKKQTDGATVYILTDRNTGDKFQFASRSIAWPPGITAEQ